MAKKTLCLEKLTRNVTEIRKRDKNSGNKRETNVKGSRRYEKTMSSAFDHGIAGVQAWLIIVTQDDW